MTWRWCGRRPGPAPPAPNRCATSPSSGAGGSGRCGGDPPAAGPALWQPQQAPFLCMFATCVLRRLLPHASLPAHTPACPWPCPQVLPGCPAVGRALRAALLARPGSLPGAAPGEPRLPQLPFLGMVSVLPRATLRQPVGRVQPPGPACWAACRRPSLRLQAPDRLFRAACHCQLQEDGSLLRAAQAYDAGSLPQGWPEPAAQPAGAAPPAAQHPANQQGDGEGDQGRGGSGPPRANGRAGGGGGRGGPSAAAGRGTKRKAGAPAAGDHGQWQPGRPIVSASGYPGVYRSRWGGWYGKMTPPGRRSACDLLSDHDVQVVAVGRQLALFWASLVSQGQHRPAPHPPLRDRWAGLAWAGWGHWQGSPGRVPACLAFQHRLGFGGGALRESIGKPLGLPRQLSQSFPLYVTLSAASRRMRSSCAS